MTDCLHCGTSFHETAAAEKFCCHGCEFVHALINSEGLERFYGLRGNSNLPPVRSAPFVSHDFSWLEKSAHDIESTLPPGSPATGGFSLEGVSCVGCVWLVENLFLRRSGAMECAANPATGNLHLRWVAGEMDLAAFAREVASFGYTMTPRSQNAARGEARQLAVRAGLCAAFAMNAMVFTLPRYTGMPLDFAFAPIFQLIAFLSAILSMLVGGGYFIRRAWLALRTRTLHIDLPIALGIVIAFSGSIVGWAGGIEGLLYFDFVSMFIFLMLGGRYIQVSAVEKNRNRLQRRKPVPETLRSPDHAEPLALEDIVSNTRFELPSGQAVPVAATLDSLPADFSLEWINGEAAPQTFQPGRSLPAGAILLGNTPVTLTARETWEDSLLRRLTQAPRASIRVPALEKLLRFYLLAVLVIGTTGFFWWLSHGSTAQALQVMISVFVVSCPCALGVALPLADELCGSTMERLGVFIKEPLLWSRLKRVRTLIFDKTGTLTMERPVLTNPSAITQLGTEEKIALTQLTSDSLHPVSRSLLETLGSDGQRWLRDFPTPEVTDVPGAGRFYHDETGIWSLGRPGWNPETGEVPQTGSPGTVFMRNGFIIARFLFVESLRPEARAAIDSLRARRFRIVILSGDHPEKVATAAARLGIPAQDAHARLRPTEKEDLVRKIDRQDTLYLGDGANDSLAFNVAWATGTPVVDRSVLEGKADFYFMGSGLRFLPRLLALSRHRNRVVRSAFAFALVYNLTAIAFSLAGHMNPLVAAIIMPLSSAISLSIVALGLWERRYGVAEVAMGPENSYLPPWSASVPLENDQRGQRLRTNSV
ncbi:heavy metal translocating P-type ATPase metal-binding domain-containing protein [Luteolibacter yonseiensis]|uniref:Heavy metal translocating P-type ATPase metal-binding domain-containing protein n=1 Tax=Luteolibacter yonseiensis TaxID=1144680 RepID=A0A934R0X4_9BACT|nr:heavy metal translocating P-type ATPase metal-binding domain-containing protein [Luteolibacter yonseiensis]MBK1814306.1 heavy metal translocating P-type ATPase metal-binding domain-containing protein [Luteolibacter yonseiensis]